VSRASQRLSVGDEGSNDSSVISLIEP
jgi:hypothetical protein